MGGNGGDSECGEMVSPLDEILKESGDIEEKEPKEEPEELQNQSKLKNIVFNSYFLENLLKILK